MGSVSAIESSMNWVDVSVLVEITNLLGVKLAGNVGSEPVRFDVSAKLEEKERRSGRVIVLFALTVRTKPSVVKYEVEGSATLTGKDTLIDKVLEVDPNSRVPFVFHRVYQHVFTAIYMLASLIGTIYPPPDLLSSSGQGVPVRSLKTGEQAKVAEVAKATEAAETAEVARMPEVAEATEPAKTAEPTEPVAERGEEAKVTEPMRPAEPAERAVEREETTAQQTEALST